MKTDNSDVELKLIEQQIQAQKKNLNTTAEQKFSDKSWWSTTNAMTMSSVVLLFGLIVIAFATYLIRKDQSTEAVLRVFGTILIIVIAVFLVVAGYSDKQIAPVMGLLGTIVGYLLGKDTRPIKNDKN